jgi:D-glycero-D-manno-heptose 1,7-bisphosphate phosphatase
LSARAVFLDRDGVINELAYFSEVGVIDSPLNPDQFKLLPGVAKSIRDLRDLGVKVVIASNQPAIAKGKTTEDLFDQIRSKMMRELQIDGARIDGEYYCFHHPDAIVERYKANCDCRKPKPGLLLKASHDLGLDLSRSFLVGDSLTDVKAGRAAGCTTILIGSVKCDICKLMQQGNVYPDFMVEDLAKAVDVIRER